MYSCDACKYLQKNWTDLVDAATDAGALGAKLSGGGMGGNMIALCKPADIDLVKLALRHSRRCSSPRLHAEARMPKRDDDPD